MSLMVADTARRGPMSVMLAAITLSCRFSPFRFPFTWRAATRGILSQLLAMHFSIWNIFILKIFRSYKGSHCGLLGSDIVLSCRWTLIFLGDILHLPSEEKPWRWRQHVRFEVNFQSKVFQNVMLCSLVEEHQCFGRILCLHLTKYEGESVNMS